MADAALRAGACGTQRRRCAGDEPRHAMIRPYYSEAGIEIYLGDCREILPQLEPVDHVITDPPYALDVYLRMASFVRQDTGDSTRVGAGGRRVADGGGIMRMAAGDIGHITDLLDDVAGHIPRITGRWALVFSDVETTFRWRS